MTTKSRLTLDYVRGSGDAPPKIFVRVHLPILSILQSLLTGIPASHELSEIEVEELSRALVKRKIVKSLRDTRLRAKTQ